MSEISISLVSESKVGEYDLTNIVFGQIFTDHMFMADFDGEKWTNFEIKPLRAMEMHPGNMTLHYGQAIFEGMKATMHKEGYPMLWRPEMHAKRINFSAERLCMPEFPEDLFVEAISKLVRIEKNWIPRSEGSALYIRPFMFANDACIGVRESKTYKFIICCLPAGPYYAKPVKLKVEDQYIRAAKGGVGEAKAAGNYAASLYPTKLARQEGFDQIAWLDASEFKYLQEVGTMNIFFVLGDKVVTPLVDGTILRGITRDSIIQILKSKGMEVEERLVSIDELVEAHKSGELKEVFGSGTAAVVALVEMISYKGNKMTFDPDRLEIGQMVKDEINKIRVGEVEDTFGWTVKLASEIEAVY